VGIKMDYSEKEKRKKPVSILAFLTLKIHALTRSFITFLQVGMKDREKYQLE
jgi:hypothetical protein